MIYTGKVRVRVCGILIEENRILLLKHEGLGSNGHLWLPPGGGLEFNETAEEALIKEFQEETNLLVEVEKYLFVNEFKGQNHHAIELFFSVKRIGGDMALGRDPELKHQILSEIAFFSIEEILNVPKDSLHSSLQKIQSLEDLFELTGYYKFVQ